MGLTRARPRPLRTTTKPDPHAPDTVELVKRDFTAQQPATKLVGDITYIRTWQGWLYLAVLADCATREVIGYARAEHRRTKLVVEALQMAMRNRRLEPDCNMPQNFTVARVLLWRSARWQLCRGFEVGGRRRRRVSCGDAGSFIPGVVTPFLGSSGHRGLWVRAWRGPC
ncbi:DDE-type integrase/transposase/recombinase [Mycobacterium sp. SM1]|uniref:DDE-type integrase/transposase/recombinase n=1 Tax=Mycobacterium sp. SM1 TaxID=2816243 RepID=UPI001BD165AF|nr:DDE-type integrase/transposase/recombinase [Mycobacterium sp. SM1]